MVVDPGQFDVDEARYRTADPSWLDELDDIVVHAGEPHQRMGTRGVDESAFLLLDDLRADELALRRRLWNEARAEVYAAKPTALPAAEETAALVRDWLAGHRRQALADWDDSVPEPLARAGLAVQEDLCLMERDDTGWRLSAAMLCFPTFWRLDEKIGREQGQVHGPVPYYAQELERKVGHFFDRLRPGRIVGRRNWGFSAVPNLFAPDLAAFGDLAYSSPESLWLRSERQTLRRLPATGAILFTIRVQQAPAAAVADRPALVRRLRLALEGWPRDLMDQRAGGRGWGPPVLDWLRRLDTDVSTDQASTKPS